MASGDPLREVLARFGVGPHDEPFQALDALLGDAPRAARLADALAAALARVAAGAPAARLLLALGTAHLRAGDPSGAVDLLREAAGALGPAAAEQPRALSQLAAAELARGEPGRAQAALAQLAPRLHTLPPRLLREVASTLGGAGAGLAAAALSQLARARERAPDQGDPRLGVLARLVAVLGSAAAGTAEPLWEVLRAVLEQSGGDRSCLLLYRGQELGFELGLTRAGQRLGPEDFAYSSTIVDQALREASCVAVPDVQAALPYALADSARELGLHAAVCVPLRVARKRVGAAAVSLPCVRGIAGVLYVDAQAPGAFGPQDAAFFDALADCALLGVRAQRTAAALSQASAAPPPRARSRPGSGRPAAPAAASSPRPGFEDLLTADPPTLAALDLVARAAQGRAAVLIRGESGTGKERVAQALHRLSGRSGPLVTVDCAALPDGLLQRELFGHEAGAFTGATSSSPGLFEQAHGGTLFLDEVGEATPALQAALLRAVQEGEVRRLGGDTARPVDVRLVSATHRDLRAMTERGAFRQDLLYRLAGVDLRLPPLRDRGGDVALLVQRFLRELAPSGEAPLELEQAALERLEEHAWPGNVRELENALRAAALLADGPTLTLAQVDAVLGGARGGPAAAEDALAGSMEEIEARAIRSRLEEHDWNQVATARSLGIDRNTLKRKMVRHGIVRGGPRP